MARPRTFEPDDALDAAMRVFWRKGFAETSYDDLVSATGVSRKGLYTVFGDKQALFLAALKHYRETVVQDRFAMLDRPDVTAADIRGVVRWFADMAGSGKGAMGCLMANTAADETIGQPQVKAEVKTHLTRLAARFTAACRRAGFAGARADALGPYLTGVLQGLFVLAHARADRTLIDSYIGEALAALD